MYVGISTQTFDLQGSLLFKADIANTELEKITRRVTRSATLDGGVSITDSGYSDGDRTLNIAARLTEAQVDRLKYIFKNYSEVILAIPEGIFLVNLNSLTNVYGEVGIKIFVSEKLAPIGIPAYYCARDDTFKDLNWWYITKKDGAETATPYVKGLTDHECTIDLPDATDSQITLFYQYLIPNGDFEITLDLADYTPDSATDGFVLMLKLRSSTDTYHSSIATRTIAAGSYQTTRVHKEDIVVNTTTDVVADPTQVVRITRVGNDLSINYFANEWQTEYVNDFGVNSSDIDRIEIIAYDTVNRGGSVDIDNLMFRQGCPSTYPKAWTTTCSSSSSSTSSTASSTSSSSSFSTTSSTASTTSSTSSTASTTTTATTGTTTTSSTVSSSSTSSSTASTISTTSTSTSTESTTSTYYCAYNQYFADMTDWAFTKLHGAETAMIIGERLRLDVPDGINGSIDGLYKYQIPTGDARAMVSLYNYSKDHFSLGPYARLRLSDATNTDYAEVHLYHWSGNKYVVFETMISGTPSSFLAGVHTDALDIMIKRVGTTFYGRYRTGLNWVTIDLKNFGGAAANIVNLHLMLEDQANHGGEIHFDNLLFGNDCPDGTKAWTTTSSTTTTTLTTTSSTASTISTTTSTLSTASTSTLSTTSSTVSTTSSTLSTTSTSLSSTTSSSASTLSTTTSTSTSSSTSTTTSSTASTLSTISSTSSTTSSTSSTMSTLSTLSTTSSSTSSSSTTTTDLTTTSSTTSSSSSTSSTASTTSSTASTLSTTTTTSTSSSTSSTASTLSTTYSTVSTTTSSTTSTTSSTLSTTSSTASTTSTTLTTASSTSTTTSSTLSTTTSSTTSTSSSTSSTASTLSTTSSTASTLSTTTTSTSSSTTSSTASTLSTTTSTLSTVSTTTSVLTTTSTTDNLENQLVAWYKFNGNADDSSGNNNDGTVSGADLTTDRFKVADEAYEYNGTTDGITVAAPTGLPSGNGSYTITFWVRFDSTGGTYRTCVGIGDTGAASRIISVGVQTSGVLWVAHWTSDWVTNFTPSTDIWYHIAVTYTSGVNEKLYIDGSLQDTGGLSSLNIDSTPLGLGIAVWAGGDDPLDGKLDDVRIYTRALGLTEIQEIYGYPRTWTTTTTTTTTCTTTSTPPP